LQNVSPRGPLRQEKDRVKETGKGDEGKEEEMGV